MNKAGILLLVLVLSLFPPLFSCGGNMTEQSAKEILEDLLPKSYELNDIFWGFGLETEMNASSEAFQPVVSDKYKSTEDILSEASEVFSSEYVESIRRSVFTTNEEDGIRARYLDFEGVLKKDKTNTGFEGFSEVNGKLDLSTLKIVKQNSHAALLSLSYTNGGETELTLVNENGKWLIDSPTY